VSKESIESHTAENQPDLQAEFGLDHLFQEVKSGVRERLSNPFTLAFFVAWAFANYQVLLVIFGDAKLDEKLALIQASSTVTQAWSLPWIWQNFCIPALGAALYCIIAPATSFVVGIYQSFVKLKQYGAQRKIMLGRVAFISAPEAAELQRKIDGDVRAARALHLAEQVRAEGLEEQVAARDRTLLQRKNDIEQLTSTIEELNRRFGAPDEVVSFPKELIDRLPISDDEKNAMRNGLKRRWVRMLEDLSSPFPDPAPFDLTHLKRELVESAEELVNVGLLVSDTPHRVPQRVVISTAGRMVVLHRQATRRADWLRSNQPA
jgi:hypothetical protein